MFVIVVLVILLAITYNEKNDLLSKINQSTSNFSASTKKEGKLVTLNLTKIELAKTPDEQAVGLMNRTELCQTCGMLFEFEKPQELVFWMKNTFISLDMIFLDENGKITNIAKKTPPLNQIDRFKSGGLAKYVLEVNGGFSDKINLETGDRLEISKIKSSTVKIENVSSTEVNLYI